MADELEPGGGARQHLTFGYGIHYRVGTPLARAELKIGLRAILERLQNFRLVGAVAVECTPHRIARGPRRLPHRCERRW